MFFQPNHYTITLPGVPADWKGGDTYRREASTNPESLLLLPKFARLVGARSPSTERKAIELMSKYFSRETGYRQLYTAADPLEEPPDLVVMLLVGEHPRLQCAGAVSMRWRAWKIKPARFGMQWVWLHPYIRSKKYMSTLWPYLQSRFGHQFAVEPPLSTHIKHLVEKYGHPVD